jgi:hypothetical protein
VCLPATLDDKRLDAVLIQVIHQLGQRAMVRQYDALGIRSVPMTNGQLGMFANVGGMSHQDGIFLSTQLMREHLRLFVGNLQCLAILINESVGSLSPF